MEESEGSEIFGYASQLPVIKVRNLQSCFSDTNIRTTPMAFQTYRERKQRMPYIRPLGSAHKSIYEKFLNAGRIWLSLTIPPER
jgi:hypothetical protein